jgi:hypothetical protein
MFSSEQFCMSFEPHSWNVIIAGAWNRAIFTPEWIAKNIFRVESNVAVNIDVPLNFLAPFRVRYGDIAVLVSSSMLEVAPDSCSYELLDKARECARYAIEELPRTPITAAGFNFRYRCTELSLDFIEISECKIDKIFSDGGFEIIGRQIRRSLKCGDGVINVEFRFDQPESAILGLNFHIGSSDENVLKGWLTVPMSEIRSKVEKIIKSLPGLIA